MSESPWLVASLWLGLALAASLISIRIGISIALVEICVGAVAGNTINLASTEWVGFLAGLGSALLTFLAGAEIEPDTLRQNWNWWLAAFLAASLVCVIFSPKLAHRFLHKYEDQVSEPELKLLLLFLLVLGGLAAKANSEAVLPAYVLGLVLAGTFRRHKEAVEHLRIATFALLTPFYFLKAGALVRFDAVIGGAAVIALLLAVKLAAKGVGVYPLARLFGLDRRTSKYTTLLMSTGLTFGTISAIFGLNRGRVTPAQYSALVTVVIASAVIPTFIAQKHYQHRLKVLRVQSEDEALAVTEAPQK
jgi:Kef-type K+ transport system membrane component KefB